MTHLRGMVETKPLLLFSAKYLCVPSWCYMRATEEASNNDSENEMAEWKKGSLRQVLTEGHITGKKNWIEDYTEATKLPVANFTNKATGATQISQCH